MSFLTRLGCQILARNVRTPYGEIDLIVQKDDELIFVEVKTRSSSSFGAPEVSVSSRKFQHMIDSAEFYMQEHPEFDGSYRIDVVAVIRKPGGIVQLEHFENAIPYDAA